MIWQSVIMEVAGLRDEPYRLPVRNSYADILNLLGSNSLVGTEGSLIRLKDVGTIKIIDYLFLTKEKRVVIKTKFEE